MKALPTVCLSSRNIKILSVLVALLFNFNGVCLFSLITYGFLPTMSGLLGFLSIVVVFDDSSRYRYSQWKLGNIRSEQGNFGRQSLREAQNRLVIKMGQPCAAGPRSCSSGSKSPVFWSVHVPWPSLPQSPMEYH